MDTSEKILPSGMFIDLDRSGPIPLYFQVASRIEKAIVEGELPPGSRLENEVSLGERLGLSRPTVRRAIQDLVNKGMLVRRRGIGTQVVHGQVTRGVELTSLHDDLQTSGKAPTTTLLAMRTEKAKPVVAEHLGLPANAEVIYIHRLRFSDKAPVAVMENWLPIQLVEISHQEIKQFGLYQIMRAKGITMRVGKQRIGARKATHEESELLNIEKGAAVLTMERTTFDNSGRAVEYGRHCYRPDLYSFEVTLVER